jgi:hypothetical protein
MIRFLPFLALPLAACGAPAPSATGPVTWTNTIRDLVDRRCGDCHGAKSPSMAEFEKDKEAYKKKDVGPRLSSYEDLRVVVNGSDFGALMRRLDDGGSKADGKPGNMHEHLGETPAERAAALELFKRWVGGWTLKRKAEASDADRAGIRALRD